MRPLLNITVKESVKELRFLQRKYPGKYKALQMLIQVKQNGPMSKTKLSILLGASDKSIHIWRRKYLTNGIKDLLLEKRGGKKLGAINASVHERLSERLNNPKEGFRSFIEIQQWLQEQCGIAMNYHAVNKYVKRKFGARLKVSRKSHVQKSPAAEAVFKNSVRKA